MILLGLINYCGVNKITQNFIFLEKYSDFLNDILEIRRYDCHFIGEKAYKKLTNQKDGLFGDFHYYITH